MQRFARVVLAFVAVSIAAPAQHPAQAAIIGVKLSASRAADVPCRATLPSSGTADAIAYAIWQRGGPPVAPTLAMSCAENVVPVVGGPQLTGLSLAAQTDAKAAKCPAVNDVNARMTGPPGASLRYYYLTVLNGKTSTLHNTPDAGTPQQPYARTMPASGSVTDTEAVNLPVPAAGSDNRVELHAWMTSADGTSSIAPLESVAVVHFTCAPPQVSAITLSTPVNYQTIPCPSNMPITLKITGTPGWPVTYGYQANLDPADATATQVSKQFTSTMPDDGTLAPSIDVRIPSLVIGDSRSRIDFFATQYGANSVASLAPLHCLSPTITRSTVLAERRSLQLLVIESLAAKPGGTPACAFTVSVTNAAGGPQFNGYVGTGANSASGKIAGSSANLTWEQPVDLHWTPPASGRYALDVKADGSGCTGEESSTFVW